jgi:hypothetical protein
MCPTGKTPYPSFYKKSAKRGVYCNRDACKECGCKCTKEEIVIIPVPDDLRGKVLTRSDG